MRHKADQLKFKLKLDVVNGAVLPEDELHVDFLVN